MENKVSIIVPIYNVEQYLETCICSILNQTYKNLEILLIDDGSTDSSGKICNQFCKKDNRIKVFHKINGGLSDARNYGIDKATGDLLFFIDSDDFIGESFISELVDLLIEYNADIVIAPLCHVKETTNKSIDFNEEVVVETLNPICAIEESLYQRKFSCNAHSKLYKRKIFSDIRFPEGKISEDLAIAHKVFEKANLIVCTNKWGYYYRQREKSIMHSFNIKRLDALGWVEEIENEYSAKGKEMCLAINCRRLNIATHLLLDIPDYSKVDVNVKSYIWKEIKQSRKFVILNKKARIQDRAAGFVSYLGPYVLRFLWDKGLAIKRKEY